MYTGKQPIEVSRGPQPSDCIPFLTTCASETEALRSKVTPVTGREQSSQANGAKAAEKIAAGELFRRGVSP